MTKHHQELAIECTEAQAKELVNKLALLSDARWQYGGQHRLPTNETEYRFYRTNIEDQTNGYIKFDGYIAFLYRAETFYTWDCHTDGSGISVEQNNKLIEEFEGRLTGSSRDLGLTVKKGKAQVR